MRRAAEERRGISVARRIDDAASALLSCQIRDGLGREHDVGVHRAQRDVDRRARLALSVANSARAFEIGRAAPTVCAERPAFSPYAGLPARGQTAELARRAIVRVRARQSGARLAY